MAANKNAMLFRDLGFADQGTQKLVAYAAVSPRKPRRPLADRDASTMSAASRFMLLCEQEHSIPRRAFRQMIVDALVRHDEVSERQYFMDHDSVFNDWFYSVRPIPTWANQILAELMLGMLRDEKTSAKLKMIVRVHLEQVLQDVAGGSELLSWILSTSGRLMAA